MQMMQTEEHDPTLARIQPARQPAGLPAICLRTVTGSGCPPTPGQQPKQQRPGRRQAP